MTMRTGFLRVSKNNVDYLDLRACEKEDGISHYDMFYKTDHHWNARAAIWGSGRVAGKLSELYGYEYTPELLTSVIIRAGYTKRHFLEATEEELP